MITLDEQIEWADHQRKTYMMLGDEFSMVSMEAILATLRSVKQAEPVAWGMPNTAITGKRHALMMVRLDIPGDDQYGGVMWIPLYPPLPRLSRGSRATRWATG